MSANHGNNLEQAIETIKAAKKSGADAIKIQTYTADTLTLDCKDKAYEAKGAWKGQYLYELYKDASMPWEWAPVLQNTAKKEDIILFSTPFDFSSVDFLETLNMPAYKIASPEIIDLPLIRYIAKTKKPIILSTGNATLAQIDEAVSTIAQEGVKELAILKCTSEYPAPAENINLKTIPNLKDIYKCPVGLSDHTLGTAVPIASVALGANIIEKHFILDKNIKTADSFFSANPKELEAIVQGSQQVFKALGDIHYPLIQNPNQRSLIAIKDIQKDEIFTKQNMKSLRPGGGIAPKEIEKIYGRKATESLKKGTLLNWEMVGKVEK